MFWYQKSTVICSQEWLIYFSCVFLQRIFPEWSAVHYPDEIHSWPNTDTKLKGKWGFFCDTVSPHCMDGRLGGQTVSANMLLSANVNVTWRVCQVLLKCFLWSFYRMSCAAGSMYSGCCCCYPSIKAHANHKDMVLHKNPQPLAQCFLHRSWIWRATILAVV